MIVCDDDVIVSIRGINRSIILEETKTFVVFDWILTLSVNSEQIRVIFTVIKATVNVVALAVLNIGNEI